MGNFQDLTGKVFNNITVLHRTKNNHLNQTQWVCRCICGKVWAVVGNCLKTGNTKSCGCVSLMATTKRFTKHGHTSKGTVTPEYRAWRHLFDRCDSPKCREYINYGGRGIGICNRWRDSFDNFLRDMGHKPFPEAAIDRIDNNGDYTPENCRWVTASQNNMNRRNNRILTYNGVSKALTEWARESITTVSTFSSRINRGWSVHDAMTKPLCK